MSRATDVIIQGWMATVVLAMFVAPVSMTGCQEVEIARHSPWDDFDLADRPADQSRPTGSSAPASPNMLPEGEAPSLTPLVVNHDDGSVTLNAFLPEHVVTHLRNCLIDASYDTIYDQLVSPKTTAQYAARDLDAREELTAWFEENRRELLLMLRYIPAGIDSPNVISEVRGSIYRLKIHDWIASKGAGDGPLKFQTLELDHSGGRFYLKTIY